MIVKIIIISSLFIFAFQAHSAKLSHFNTIKYSKYLKDPAKKLSKDFKAHPKIMKRVKFWFGVYTNYHSNQHIIHHTKYPWIIYDIIDTSNIKSDKRKINATIRIRKNEIKRIINKLSKLKKFTKLNTKEYAIFKKLRFISKNYKKQLWLARNQIRSQTGLKDHFKVGLENSLKYQEQINDIFKQKNIPTEISALPLVESNFNTKAISKVGASGIWQIMKPTGQQYGIVNRLYDERNSPFKATLMAAKLLKFNFSQFSNWPLAITAYNNGAGNLRRAIRRAKTKNPYRLINNHKRGAFGFASSNFYASFIAALYVKSYAKHIFKINKNKEIFLEKVKFKRRTTLKYIARKTGQSLKKIKSLNLDLKNQVSLSTRLPKNFTLYLPKGSSKMLLNKNIVLVNFIGKKIKKNSGS